MLDDVSEAVLAREEVLKYPRAQVHAILDELRTTQRHKFYRALQHPLYPILRKIERKHEQLHHVTTAVRSHRLIYASNHKSHTDYLVEPLVLDDNGVRPPSSPPASTCSAARSG
jgi:glycerol-3-phosphate O-acyltransferase